MAFLTDLADRVEQVLPIPKGLHKFILVGLMGLATHTSVYSLLRLVGALRPLSWVCGLVIATAVTWTLNRRMTFAASGRTLQQEAFRYILVTAVAQSVSFAVFQMLSGIAPGLPGPIDVIVGAAVATIFSYLGNRFFTFAPQTGLAVETSEP